MARGVVRYLVAPLVVTGLVGCGFLDYEVRDPWRAEAEARCMSEGLVQASAYIQQSSEIKGRGTCGMTRPLKVAALGNGSIGVKPKATLACPIIANVDSWFAEAVQPAAMAWFGEPVAEIRQISAYSCRTMNGQPGASISEHAYGNALDIASFTLQSGRTVTVKDGWKGRREEQGFLRSVHAAACERFSTMLGPGADMFHYDHIHVDLARRASGRTVCRPAPQNVRPPAGPRAPEGVPVARTPTPAPVSASRSQPDDSPWARSAPRSAGTPPVARAATQRPVSQPLVLGGQAPPPDSFGAPVGIESRVMQSLGSPARSAPPAQQAPAMTAPRPSAPPPNAPQPTYRPSPPDPDRLVPPGRVPMVQRGTDSGVTGSIGNSTRQSDGSERGASSAGALGADLLSPQSITNVRSFNAETAPVLDPLAGKTGKD